MTATTRQAIPVVRDEMLPSFRRMLFEAFSSVLPLGYSRMELFESSSPGATEALRTWARTLGYATVESTNSNAPDTITLSVTVPGGAIIAVTRRVG